MGTHCIGNEEFKLNSKKINTPPRGVYGAGVPLHSAAYPKVSVCMPTYNRANSLKQCLDSLMALSYPNLEIIVCDNNSTDDTKDVISSYPNVRYICERTQGLSYAKNTLLDACSSDSDFVVFVDDDETVQTNWIESLLSGFSDETVAVVGGPYRNVYEHDVPDWIPDSIYPRVFEKKTGIETSPAFLGIPGGNGMCRLAIVREKKVYFDVRLGRMGSKALSGEDNEFYQKVAEPEYNYAMVYHAWVYHYIPASRMTFSYLQRLHFWDSVSEYCHRKRAAEYWMKNAYKLLIHTAACAVSIFSFNQKLIVKCYLKAVRNAGYLYGPIFRKRSNSNAAQSDT